MTLIQYAMIEIKNLSFNYNKKEPLFTGFNFKQNQGSIAGLLGKNGAGKTTLLKIIFGLLSPKEGKVNVNGFNSLNRHPDFLSEVFIIPEEFVLPATTIQKYIQILSPLYKNFDSEKMNGILKQFNLSSNSKLTKLSHGQKKKVLIAFALATNCRLLLLDEPTNGLDIPSKSIFRKVLVNSLNDDQSVLISTHQVKDIESVIDQIIILDEGKIVFQNDSNTISEKLYFKTVLNLKDAEMSLYHEKCPGGYKTITSALNGEETDIDIELLFNAIISKTNLTF